MIARDAASFAWQAVTGFRLRSLLTLLAMAIGVASVIVLTALGDGARRYVIGEFQQLGTHLLIVFAGRSETKGGLPPLLSETPRDLTIADSQTLYRSPAIRFVAPLNIGSAAVSWGGRERESPILGTSSEYLEMRGVQLATGRFLPKGNPERQAAVCVIGGTVRDELFGAQPALGQWIKVGDRRFQVIGVLASRGRSLGVDFDQLVVIPIASAQSLFNTFSLFRILVEAKSYEEIERAKRDIVSIVKLRHDGEDDVTVVTQDAVAATFDRVLLALTFALAGIAAISLSVAGILIMNVMLVSVAERTSEVGLLKALGATPRKIMTLFLLEAATLSLLGGCLGLGLGYSGTWILGRLFPALPAWPPIWAVAASLFMALAAGLIFGVLPARRASQLDPVTALARH
ncbi:MAG: ABC transporter permease [Acidobacteriota bacterium]